MGKGGYPAHKGAAGGRRTVLAKGVAQVVHRVLQGPLAGDVSLRCKAERCQHRQPAVAHLRAHGIMLLRIADQLRLRMLDLAHTCLPAHMAMHEAHVQDLLQGA